MKPEIFQFVESTAWDKRYWDLCEATAKNLKTDGCTGVPDWYVWTCWEHDVHSKTNKTIYGLHLTVGEMNWILRRRIQQASVMGVASPVSWLYWVGTVIYRWWLNKPSTM